MFGRRWSSPVKVGRPIPISSHVRGPTVDADDAGAAFDLPVESFDGLAPVATTTAMEVTCPLRRTWR